MITVITPVYNAEKYLNKTILSVIKQPEVSEYIIVDDGSIDNSWNIVEHFAQRYNIIKLIKHSDGFNHGRSKTRNLGIKNSTNKWIAFLDADDYYLEDRFRNDLKLIKENPSIDGIYNAIGVFYYNSFKESQRQSLKLTTINEKIHPDYLFENMSPIGNKGWFSGDGFLIKKHALINAGFFNEKLIVAEDTDLWVKLSLCNKLISGIIDKPVAIRGVHDKNVFYDKSQYKKPRLLMYKSLILYSLDKNVTQDRFNLILSSYLSYIKSISRYNYLKYFFHWSKVLLTSKKVFLNKILYIGLINYNLFLIKKIFKKLIN